jgi:hypothetical protein
MNPILLLLNIFNLNGPGKRPFLLICLETFGGTEAAEGTSS